jgi:deoxyribose-phosphate aldolase
MLIEQEVSIHLIKKIYSLIDLTSLNENDDSDKVAALCGKAVRPDAHVAAVCVYPQFVKQVVAALHETPVKIATVVNFPEGDDSLESITHSIQRALNDGANEIDLVFPYSRYLAGEESYAKEFLNVCKSVCGDHTLKVILETGALDDLKTIADVSELAIEAGADFLKTSTGKMAIGATLTAATVMLQTIKSASRSVGFKVSGGVRTISQALEYIALAEKIMDVGWVTSEHFRIGASQLVDVLLKEC